MFRTLCAVFAIISLFHLQIGNFEHKQLLNWNSAYAADMAVTSTQSKIKDYKGVDASKMDISGADGFIDIINLIVITLIGKSLLTCTGAWKQPEALSFIMGAVMYVVGEIVGFTKYEKARKNVKESFFDKSKDKGGQIESLDAIIADLNNLREAAEAKKGWQSSAATSFTIAAGIAVAKYIMYLIFGGICVGACTAGAATVVGAPICAAPAAAAGVAYGAGIVNWGVPKPSATSYVATKTNGTTMGNATVSCPVCVAPCKLTGTWMKLSSVMCVTLGVAKTSSPNSPEYFVAEVLKYRPLEPNMSVIEKRSESFTDRLMNFVFAKAEASGGWTNGWGLAAKIVTLIATLAIGVGRVVDTFIEGPLGRSIAFGVAAGLGYTAKASTQKMVDKIDGEIEKATEIRMALATELNTPDINTTKINPYSGRAKNISGNLALSRDKRANSKFPCVDAPADSDAKISKTSAGCPSFKKIVQNDPTLNGSDKNFNINGFGDFSSLMSESADITDNLQGQESVGSGTIAAANSFGEKGAMATKLLKDLQNRANEELKKSGRSPVDFEKAQNDLLSELRTTTSAELKKSGIGASDLLAALGASATKDEPEKKKAAANMAAPEIVIPEFKMPEIGTIGSSDAETATESEENVADKIDMNKMNNAAADIIDRPETSIFQVISTRYHKTGMKHLGVLSKSPQATTTVPAKQEAKK